MLKKGYTPPEVFCVADKWGYIEDEDNIPVIFYIQRHRAKKALIMDEDRYEKSKFTYSTSLRLRDKYFTSRLNSKNWWLQNDAKHIDDIRRRSKRKKNINFVYVKVSQYCFVVFHIEHYISILFPFFDFSIILLLYSLISDLFVFFFISF